MNILEKLTKIKNILLDILFPPICLSCKSCLPETERSRKVCQKCLGSIQIYSSFFCPKCKSRVPDTEKSCHKEIKFLLAPATDYQNLTVKNLIWFLKYHKWRGIIKIIKPMIDEYLNMLNYNFRGFVIIPIPLHPDRLKERGFNQSELIAEIFAHSSAILTTSCHLMTNNLKRVKATKTQAELKNINERIKNIENCFALDNPKEIENKNIVLVDDVFTTGSTMSEAVKILKQAGAKKIIAFVFAKA
ncbi:MAG: ComF family protein [bacterium]|nr:ComF family protein [bacterium]